MRLASSDACHMETRKRATVRKAVYTGVVPL